MKHFGFEIAHGYEIWRGYISAVDVDTAKEKILNHEWDDIIDSFDKDNFTEGYEIADIWEYQ